MNMSIDKNREEFNVMIKRFIYKYYTKKRYKYIIFY